jgi:hypothetical protein
MLRRQGELDVRFRNLLNDDVLGDAGFGHSHNIVVSEEPLRQERACADSRQNKNVELHVLIKLSAEWSVSNRPTVGLLELQITVFQEAPSTRSLRDCGPLGLIGGD